MTDQLFRDVTCRDDVQALSRFAGIAERDLVALADDPFLTGTETDWEKAQWVAEIVERYGVDVHEKHGRGLHYIVLSHDELRPDGKQYVGTEADERLLTDAVGYARELGLLPWDAFPDRKGTVYADDDYRRSYVEPEATVTLPQAYVPTLYLPRVTPWSVSFSRPSALGSQPVLIDVLTEKAGIAPQLATITRRYGCRLLVTEGFSGKARAAMIVKETIEEGRPRIVLSFSDADSSGESMPNATARHLEWLARTVEDVPPIYFKPVALTLAQLAGIEERIGRKIPLAPDVGRSEGRVELDALPEYAPGWLEEQLETQLWALFARVDFSPLDDAEARVTDELADEFAEVQSRMNEIAAQARAILETPEARELRVKLERLAAAMRETETEATEIADNYDDDLPDPDVSEIDFGAIDWLLDPDRDYVEQLDAYRRHEPVHRRRPPLGEITERRCAYVYCGGPMTHRKAIAKFCCDEHKSEQLKLDRRTRRSARRVGP